MFTVSLCVVYGQPGKLKWSEAHEGIQSQRRWWPTKEQWLERRLEKLGHEVIFAELR
jgi:hypothetical protein